METATGVEMSIRTSRTVEVRGETSTTTVKRVSCDSTATQTTANQDSDGEDVYIAFVLEGILNISSLYAL